VFNTYGDGRTVKITPLKKMTEIEERKRKKPSIDDGRKHPPSSLTLTEVLLQ
jgi:hypothetical protein